MVAELKAIVTAAGDLGKAPIIAAAAAAENGKGGACDAAAAAAAAEPDKDDDDGWTTLGVGDIVSGNYQRTRAHGTRGASSKCCPARATTT